MSESIKGKYSDEIELLEKEVEKNKIILENFKKILIEVDPNVMEEIEKENTELEKRIENITKAYYFLARYNGSLTNPKDIMNKTKDLKNTATNYFNKLKIKKSLWKDLK